MSDNTNRPGAVNTTPLPPTEGWELNYDKLIADAFANHKYRQGTRECVAFKNGAHWAMHNFATQARADLEAENKRLREALQLFNVYVTAMENDDHVAGMLAYGQFEDAARAALESKP